MTNQELNALKAGAFFQATNPTFGTGIVSHLVTSYDATKPLLVIRNISAPAAGLKGPDVIPHYIRLICTATGSASTSSHIALVLDTIDRYTSGGTALTLACTHSAMDPLTDPPQTAQIASLRFGVVTAPAASANVRQLGRAVVKVAAAPCWTVGDEIIINLGPVAVAGRNTTHSLLLYMWNPGNTTTAPSFEVEVGGWMQM